LFRNRSGTASPAPRCLNRVCPYHGCLIPIHRLGYLFLGRLPAGNLRVNSVLSAQTVQRAAVVVHERAGAADRSLVDLFLLPPMVEQAHLPRRPAEALLSKQDKRAPILEKQLFLLGPPHGVLGGVHDQCANLETSRPATISGSESGPQRNRTGLPAVPIYLMSATTPQAGWCIASPRAARGRHHGAGPVSSNPAGG